MSSIRYDSDAAEKDYYRSAVNVYIIEIQTIIYAQ